MAVGRTAPTPLSAKAPPRVRKCDSSPAKVVDSGVAELLRKRGFSSEGFFGANEAFWTRLGCARCERLSVRFFSVFWRDPEMTAGDATVASPPIGGLRVPERLYMRFIASTCAEMRLIS